MRSKKWIIASATLMAGLALAFLVMCDSSRISDFSLDDSTAGLGYLITLPTVGDSIELNSVVSDTANTIMTVDLSVHEGIESSVRKIRLESLVAQDICSGWRATALNTDMTDTLWVYTVEWDCSDLSWYQLTEQAGDDILSMKIQEDNDTLIETYIQNGDTLELIYDLYYYDGIHGETAKYSGTELNTIDSLMDEFSSYYDTTAAFNSNVDGDLLTEILDCQDFWDWMYDRMYDNPEHQHPREILDRNLDSYCDQPHWCPAKCGNDNAMSNPSCRECVAAYLLCSFYDFLMDILT